MSLLLEEVQSATNFNAIWPVHFEAFRNPYNSFSKFFNPVHTSLHAATETSKARHVAMWEANPVCHWAKVTETSTGQVVGAACWDVIKGFTANQRIDGSEAKLWAERLIGGLRSVVIERIRDPRLELKQMIVHPEHWRQGVARMLTKWGTDIADERCVESVVVAVPYARRIYEKLGFECIEEINSDFSTPNPGEKWKEWQKEDMRAFLMVRPPRDAACKDGEST
ncbi:hypothetical protein GQ44DRAFT_795037 [Phaeosphaeriaceae sp. PMI808]|nr:hypothetical protein GQ44DRAFT_795037 [Phaeosphaeriaceae sp. PMI808]